MPVANDYDGDGKSDVAVYLSDSGSFGIRYSSGIPDKVIPFGIAGKGKTIPVSGDFDGDGKTDLAVYLPSRANFAYRPSGGGSDVYNYFGPTGEGQTLPAPGDYTGVGHDQVAAYLSLQGDFALRPGGGSPDSVFRFGTAGSGRTIPVTVVDEALTQVAPAQAASLSMSNNALIPDVLSVPGLASAKKKSEPSPSRRFPLEGKRAGSSPTVDDPARTS
ncbi:FG-GAP repeat domain-containing protein [Tundrisphaera lichenicola]|uniref:FG-GAP repeat domain-containing protein n=1 Tax=Tundrisphaera lichenicola TaxID=2029860 RepID=UPI003EB8EC88